MSFAGAACVVAGDLGRVNSGITGAPDFASIAFATFGALGMGFGRSTTGGRAGGGVIGVGACVTTVGLSASFLTVGAVIVVFGALMGASVAPATFVEFGTGFGSSMTGGRAGGGAMGAGACVTTVDLSASFLTVGAGTVVFGAL